MKVRVGARHVTAPSGVEWRVGRYWLRRGLPRWRRVRVGDAVGQALDGASWLPLDVGDLEGLPLLLAAIVAVVVVAVILIPLLLFGVELIVAGLIVAAGILARALLARPWVIRATPGEDMSRTLTWKAKGWRRSTRVIDEVASALAAGLEPSSAEVDGRLCPHRARAVALALDEKDSSNDNSRVTKAVARAGPK